MIWRPGQNERANYPRLNFKSCRSSFAFWRSKSWGQICRQPIAAIHHARDVCDCGSRLKIRCSHLPRPLKITLEDRVSYQPPGRPRSSERRLNGYIKCCPGLGIKEDAKKGIIIWALLIQPFHLYDIHHRLKFGVTSQYDCFFLDCRRNCNSVCV